MSARARAVAQILYSVQASRARSPQTSTMRTLSTPSVRPTSLTRGTATTQSGTEMFRRTSTRRTLSSSSRVKLRARQTAFFDSSGLERSVLRAPEATEPARARRDGRISVTSKGWRVVASQVGGVNRTPAIATSSGHRCRAFDFPGRPPGRCPSRAPVRLSLSACSSAVGPGHRPTGQSGRTWETVHLGVHQVQA